MAKQYDENEVMKMLGEPENQRRAFGIIVQQYTETLYWKIRRIVLDHDDANDVLQNTFLKAWNSIGDFQYRIAINESLDHLRKQQHKISTDMDLSVANRLMADDYFDGDDAQALLQEAIAELPDVQRTVFTLRYYDEMKYSELSKLTGTSEGALKASYHIAVKKISEYVLNHSTNTTSNKKTI